MWAVMRTLRLQEYREGLVEHSHDITLQQCNNCPDPCDCTCQTNLIPTILQSLVVPAGALIFCSIIPGIVCLSCVDCDDPCCGRCQSAIRTTTAQKRAQQHE